MWSLVGLTTHLLEHDGLMVGQNAALNKRKHWFVRPNPRHKAWLFATDTNQDTYSVQNLGATVKVCLFMFISDACLVLLEGLHSAWGLCRGWARDCWVPRALDAAISLSLNLAVTLQYIWRTHRFYNAILHKKPLYSNDADKRLNLLKPQKHCK